MQAVQVLQRCESCGVALTRDGWCDRADAGDDIDTADAVVTHPTRTRRRYKCGTVGQSYPCLLCQTCATALNPTPAKE